MKNIGHTCICVCVYACAHMCVWHMYICDHITGLFDGHTAILCWLKGEINTEKSRCPMGLQNTCDESVLPPVQFREAVQIRNWLHQDLKVWGSKLAPLLPSRGALGRSEPLQLSRFCFCTIGIVILSSWDFCARQMRCMWGIQCTLQHVASVSYTHTLSSAGRWPWFPGCCAGSGWECVSGRGVETSCGGRGGSGWSWPVKHDRGLPRGHRVLSTFTGTRRWWISWQRGENGEMIQREK